MLALIALGPRRKGLGWSARGLAELAPECFCRGKATAKTIGIKII